MRRLATLAAVILIGLAAFASNIEQPGLVVSRSITLSPMQVANLSSTPVTFVPGVAGAIIVPLSIGCSIDYQGTPYTGMDNITLTYPGWGFVIDTCTPQLYSATENFFLSVPSFGFGASESVVTGADLQITSGAFMDPPAGGNSPITMKVVYFLQRP
jgi:hypothetical protein